MGDERVVEEFDRYGEEHKVRCLESLFCALVMLRPIGVDARSVDESDVAVPVIVGDLVGRDARADRDVEGPVGERFDERRLPTAVIAGKHQERGWVCFDRETFQQRLGHRRIELGEDAAKLLAQATRRRRGLFE